MAPPPTNADKENRTQSSQSTYAAGRHYEHGNMAHLSATDQIGRSAKPPISIAGRAKAAQAAQLRQAHEKPPHRQSPAASTQSLSELYTSTSHARKDDSPSFMQLIPTSSASGTGVDKGKEKAKSGTIIELDDDSTDHDSIKDDSDSSSRPVQTSKTSTRARMSTAQGSSASRAIPQGNTQAKQAIYEGQLRGQGTTIHNKPPSHEINASPDSFALENKGKARGGKMVDRMLSNRSSLPQSGKLKKEIAQGGFYSLPMSCVITQDGTYRQGQAGLELLVSTSKEAPYFAIQGECISVKRGHPDKPNITDVVINPGHIHCITAPSDSGCAMTFLKIDIDAEADLSDSMSPRSPFCKSV